MNRIIDKPKPFSDSLYWRAQREFYHQKGIAAWSSEVPFYITSNPFIAKNYAELIIRFIQDWIRHTPTAISKPFYFIELGAGSGQFSFYLLSALTTLKNQLSLQHIEIHYIMTDFTENNIQFWRTHEKLKPFIDENILDFALFDIENSTTITTLIHGLKLQKNSSTNPLIVCANYLFDSVVNDIFYVEKNKLFESIISLSSKSGILHEKIPKDISKIKISHKNFPVSSNRYDNSSLNKILKKYKNNLKKSYFLFPIGSLRGIEQLQKISDGKLLLLSSDKGYSTLQQLDEQDFPELDFHGSFSLMVNYHAIAEYFSLQHGDATLQSPRDGLITGIFSSGFTFNTLPETRHAIQNCIEEFSPTDYFNYFELTEKFYKKMNLQTIATTLMLSNWDPFVFEMISSRIIELVTTENSEVIDYIIQHLPNIIANYYPMPGGEDIYFTIGSLYYAIDDYKKAAEFYTLSEKSRGASYEASYNLALCYLYLKNYKRCSNAIQKALRIEPSNKEAKKLLRTVKKKM